MVKKLRRHLVDRLKKRLGLSEEKAQALYMILIDELTESLIKHEVINVEHFGVIEMEYSKYKKMVAYSKFYPSKKLTRKFLDVKFSSEFMLDGKEKKDE